MRPVCHLITLDISSRIEDLGPEKGGASRGCEFLGVAFGDEGDYLGGVEDVEGFVDSGAVYAGRGDAGGPGVAAGGEGGGVRVGWECEGGCNEEGGGEEGAKREHG